MSGGRSSSRRGGRKGRKPAEAGHDGPDERWMASYMDMVTVLMCLFIVLFAMSTVDQDKFAALKNSLATGFGVEQSNTVDTAEGIVVPPELVGTEGLLASTQIDGQTKEALLALAQNEQAELLKLKDRIQKRLKDSWAFRCGGILHRQPWPDRETGQCRDLLRAQQRRAHRQCPRDHSTPSPRCWHPPSGTSRWRASPTSAARLPRPRRTGNFRRPAPPGCCAPWSRTGE